MGDPWWTDDHRASHHPALTATDRYLLASIHGAMHVEQSR